MTDDGYILYLVETKEGKEWRDSVDDDYDLVFDGHETGPMMETGPVPGDFVSPQ